MDPFDVQSMLQYVRRQPRDWERWCLLGVLYDKLCDAEPALQSFERAETYAPRNVVVQYFLGREKRFIASRRHESERHLLKCVRLRPDLLAAWRLLAGIRSGENRFAEALHAWQVVARLEPGVGENFWQLGSCLVALGRRAEALVVLEHAVRLKPNHTPAHRSLVLLASARGEPDTARRYLRRLYEIDEDCARRVECSLGD